MPRAIILVAGVAAALASYFVLSLYVLPQAYLEATALPRPEPFVSDVSLSSQQLTLGENLTISVTGNNAGDTADLQIVSIGFPNLTRTDDIDVLRHDFRQTPLKVKPGDEVGSGYDGSTLVAAQYPSVEAYSRPWERGSSYSIDLNVKPENDGNFLVYVKSVALPHTWDGAHHPRQGVVDYQREIVELYSVQVTKS